MAGFLEIRQWAAGKQRIAEGRDVGMDRNQAEARITELRAQLEYHSNRYYNMDSPEISDYEYDTMMRELKSLEKDFPDFVSPDSPTQKVGGAAKREAGVLVRHNVPMLSLQDVFSKEEVEEFVEEMNEDGYYQRGGRQFRGGCDSQCKSHP